MQMSTHGDVPDQFWTVHQIGEISKRGTMRRRARIEVELLELVGRLRDFLFDEGKLRFLHRGDDRLGQRLRIFFLNDCFHVGPVDFQRARIVFLIFMKDNSCGEIRYIDCFMFAFGSIPVLLLQTSLSR